MRVGVGADHGGSGMKLSRQTNPGAMSPYPSNSPRFIYAGVVATAVILTVERADADVCVYKPPKVRRACGMIVDSDDRPISDVNVAVLKDGTTVKNATTDGAGEFDLGGIQAGKYELDATARASSTLGIN